MISVCICFIPVPRSVIPLFRRGIFGRVARIEVRMQITRRVALILGLATVLPAFAQSKVNPVNRDGSGVAIKGYDPVAYFTQSKPVKGSASFTHQWMNS